MQHILPNRMIKGNSTHSEMTSPCQAISGQWLPLTVPPWSVWFLGGWNLDKFLQQYGLRDPDTSTQIMTQFDEELSSEFGRINDDQEQFNQK